MRKGGREEGRRVKRKGERGKGEDDSLYNLLLITMTTLTTMITMTTITTTTTITTHNL
jgi:hypothetical protein